MLKELGVGALIVTNASGGINTGFEVGDFMLIEDHINLTGKSPLTGANDASLGTRFPDMTFAYAPALREKALTAAEQCGTVLRRGVYIGVNGRSSRPRRRSARSARSARMRSVCPLCSRSSRRRTAVCPSSASP